MQGWDGGFSADHDSSYAVMEAQARARAVEAQSLTGGETTFPDPPQGRVMSVIKALESCVLLAAVVAVGTWVAGGTPEVIGGAVALSLLAVVLIVAWRKLRPGGSQTPGLNEIE
jgi:hypothetical protein